MGKVIVSITKVLIDFSYTEDYQSIIKKIESDSNCLKEEPVFTRDLKLNYINNHDGSSLLFPYIIYDISNLDIFKKLIRSKSEQRKANCSISINKNSEKIDFLISNIRLYVHKFNVGFIEIEYIIKTESIQKYIDSVYFLKMFKGDNLENVIITSRVGKDEYNDELVNFKMKLLDLMDSLGGLQSNAIHNEGIAFNSLLLDDKTEEENISKYLYLLARGYKNSYKIENDNNGTNCFNNILWKSSLEGTACIAFLDEEDETTNTFLKSTMFSNKGNINRIYYNIFLSVILQRFTLIKIIGDIQNKSLVNNLSDKNQIGKYMIETKMKIVEFNLKYLFKDISDNTLYKNFHNSLIDTFNINTLLNDYDIKIKSLNYLYTIFQIEVMKEREQHNNKIEKKISQFTKIGLIVALLAFMPNFESVIKKILLEFKVDTSGFPLMSILLVIGFLTIGFYELIIWIMKRKSIENTDEGIGIETEVKNYD